MLDAVRTAWGGDRDLWVFGYGSLIARPGFEASERHVTRIHGFHRSLCMRSRVNRGTPACPGLVFGLVAGGSCGGVAFRIPAAVAHDELDRLWQREMPTGVYDPRWLRCETPSGPVQALAFTLDRRSPGFVGLPPDDQLLRILAEARGLYGTTLDYVLETARALKEHGIRDRRVERIVTLAAEHRLVDTAEAARVSPAT